MARVFNRGLGMIVIADPASVDAIRESLTESGCENWIVGRIE
jgi:phosphoribosylaminoimidazole (AIR) synthetase